MKKRIMSFVASAMLLASAMPAVAAPLFPDVKDDHWAKDAVAALAAKGLLEGYPDGTFKGDRAATRWEVAMIVARLLAKMEQAHATFATKAELEELRKLVNALREELDALGVRVTNLEENVSRLDKRVTELERITFYGYVDTRGSFGSFSNDGRVENSNAGPGGVPAFGAGTAVSPGYVDYNRAVGSTLGAGFDFRNGRPFPVVDYRNGAPLVNGVGFTTRAVLGLRIRVSEDIDAGAEFSAFTSQGNSVIDAYWGVQAPWLSNSFTASAGGLNTLLNVPYTRMTLDNFWVVHNPSHTKLILGAYSEKNIDPLIYAGQYSPNAYYGRFMDSFGFNVSGKVDVSDAGVFRWEALGTRLGDASAYENFLLGADVEFEFEGGSVKANAARVTQESVAGTIRGVGLTGFNTAVPGSVVAAAQTTGQLVQNVNAGGVGTASGYTPLQWVNPPGFFNAQQSQFNQNNGGVGSTVDQRPIPGAATGGAGQFFDQNGGTFGPQGQTMYGLGANYKFDFGGGDVQLYLSGNYAHSDYKPNVNSGYQVGGNAYKLEVGANLLDGDLDLSVQYLSVDPTYDPFILSIPGGSGFQGGLRMPDLNYFTGLYSLHDTAQYPHNRRGIRAQGQFRFMDRRGLVWAKGAFLDQVDTSLYDVRNLPNSVGGLTPNATIIGFSPGFIDPVFSGFAHPNIYGAGTANSFTTTLAPLENPRGRVTNYGIGASYKFDDPRVKVEIGYERNEFVRNSSLAPGFGGSQNQVNLNIGSLHGMVAWEASDQWTLRAGADYVTVDGHYDPAGKYNNFAIQTGSTTFNNIDTTQLSPFVGFDYDVSANTQWNMDLRYYTTTSGTNIPLNQAANSIGNSVNPFEWNGWQVSTQFKVKF
jgi:hypothetical protein